MEDLKAAALAYYSRGNQQTQDLAWYFFNSMDTDGDGKVSCFEFNDFLQKSRGYDRFAKDPNLFTKLDHNGDNHLDFHEVLTLYYIIKTTNIWCQGHDCGAHLIGLYFTCVACFDAPPYPHPHHTYDLCADCYSQMKYSHHHTYFLDNRILLRSKRGLPQYAMPNLNLAIHTPQPSIVTYNYYAPPVNTIVTYNNHAPPSPVPERIKWFGLLELAVTAANVAVNCAIM